MRSPATRSNRGAKRGDHHAHGLRQRARDRDVDTEVLSVELHALAAQERAEHRDVLLGVGSDTVVGEAVCPLDHQLVRRADAEREPRAAHRRRGRRRTVRLQHGVTRVGLQHGGAQLDGGRGAARHCHRDERIAEDRARVPQAREAVGLSLDRLLHEAVRGRASTRQSDSHGETLGRVRIGFADDARSQPPWKFALSHTRWFRLFLTAAM